MNFVEFAKQRGYDEDIVLLALKIAFEEAVRQHYNIWGANAVLEENKVHMVFRVPKNISRHDAFIGFDQVKLLDDDIFYSYIKINDQSDKFLKTVQYLFQDALTTLNLNKLKSTWKNLKNDIIYGVICSNDGKTVEVDIVNSDNYSAKGVLEKRHWVDKEKDLYKLGKGMMFYILKVTFNPLIIHLSRSSKSFPEKLFEKQLPWNSFSCQKRIPGRRSLIKTDTPINKKIKYIHQGIRNELSGEVINLQNF